MGHPKDLRAPSQLALAPHLGILLAVLRRANEHLDQVVVQAVEELALEGPLELRIIQIARMKVVIVGMYFGLSEARAENDLDAVTLRTRAELHQRMLIQLQLIKHLGEAVGGHTGIVEEREMRTPQSRNRAIAISRTPYVTDIGPPGYVTLTERRPPKWTTFCPSADPFFAGINTHEKFLVAGSGTLEKKAPMSV